jgi:mono/diheme cytochrome c family protein
MSLKMLEIMKRIIVLYIPFLLLAIFIMSFSNGGMQEDTWPVPSKYSKMKNPYADAQDSDQIGKELYMVHCRSCHGNKGIGDGKKASTLDTQVTDMTTSDFKSQTDGEIYYKSYIGRDDMPSFEKKIKEEEDRWLLVNYLKKL